MRDSDYLKQQTALFIELERTASAEPFNNAAFEDVTARITALYLCHYPSRRRRPWSALITVIMLLMVLLWIVYEVLCVLYMKGVQ